MSAFLALGFAAVAANNFEQLGRLTETTNPTICDPTVKQYAGKYAIDNNDKQYFYWAFESRDKSAGPKTPTLLWMTGGPGCSSELALTYENGPCKVNKQGTDTINNPYSWNNFSTLVYIDQPAGVGFSTGRMNDHNEEGVANDMYAFLQALFKEHPDWNTELYIFGESYGGHYAPATAHRVWKGRKNGDGIAINLAGLGVGNGLTDPEIQYQYYPQMAYNWSIEVQGKPVVSLKEYHRMKDAVPECVALIKRCNAEGGDVCTTARNTCDQSQMQPYQQTGLNPYDIRLPCDKPPLCYDFSNIDKYLNSAGVQRQLGVNKKWNNCNYRVNFQFSQDWMHNFQQMIPDLLNDNIRVLIYAGDVDWVCNWLGNKAWTLALDWPGKREFNAAGDHEWHVGSEKKGFYRTYNGFTFLQVHLAGHMVPADQPEAALSMIDTFLHNKQWN